MHTLYGAVAKRSGPGITVTGRDVQGRDVKLADVKRITITADGGTATTKDDKDYALRA